MLQPPQWRPWCGVVWRCVALCDVVWLGVVRNVHGRVLGQNSSLEELNRLCIMFFSVMQCQQWQPIPRDVYDGYVHTAVFHAGAYCGFEFTITGSSSRQSPYIC